jgi:hypothetical protein
MAQTYVENTESGIREEKAQVTVEYLGEEPLEWLCQNYVPKKDVHFKLAPGEKDTFEYDYARRIFGDWEVVPEESREKEREWNGMIAYTRRRSPFGHDILPPVRIYDGKGELLWDTQVQMAKWLEKNKANKKAFNPNLTEPSPLGNIPMPAILAEATHDQLKALWLESWKGQKMPAGMSSETARECLKPRMTATQITDVIAREYEAARETETAG